MEEWRKGGRENEEDRFPMAPCKARVDVHDWGLSPRSSRDGAVWMAGWVDRRVAGSEGSE
jgi:hypothetical protein